MFFQSNAGPIYYEVQGPQGAPAIAFTHGACLNGSMFESQVAALKDNYRVLTWDMQGHGQSAALTDNLDIVKMTDCLVAIMDESGIEEAVMVGQSLGSWVAQLLAINYPERVAGVVSIGGEPIDRPLSGFVLLAYRSALAISKLMPAKNLYSWTANNKAVTEKARQFAAESMNQIGKKQFFIIVAGMLDGGSIRVPNPPRQPLLLTHGEYEMPKSVIKANQKWHASVPGSHYYEIPGAGHNGNMDNPEAFNQALQEFLDEIYNV